MKISTFFKINVAMLALLVLLGVAAVIGKWAAVALLVGGSIYFGSKYFGPISTLINLVGKRG